MSYKDKSVTKLFRKNDWIRKNIFKLLIDVLAPVISLDFYILDKF